MPSNPLSHRKTLCMGCAALCAAVLVAGLLLPGADGAHTPLKKTPKGIKYPSGKSIRQKYTKATGTLPAGATGVQAKAANSYLLKHDDLSSKKLGLAPLFVAQRMTNRPGSLAAKWSAHYQFEVTYEKIPIAKASRALVLVGNKPLFIRDRNVPTSVDKLGKTEAANKYEDARSLGIKTSYEVIKSLYPKKTNILLETDTNEASKPRLAFFLNKEGTGQLAWEFRVRSLDRSAPFLRRYWVAARDKLTVLDYEDLVFYGSGPQLKPRQQPPRRLDPFRFVLSRQTVQQVLVEGAAFSSSLLNFRKGAEAAGTTGKVTGSVFKLSPFGPVTDSYPLRNVEVVLTKPGVFLKAITNASGEYAFPGVKGNVQVSATLDGPYARIFDDTPGTTLREGKAGNGTINLDFRVKADNEAALAQVNAFCWVNEAHDFVMPYLPASLQKLSRVKVHVNVDDTCNAFWSPDEMSLNFFRKGGGCPNTAYRDVIYHEYGHGVDDELGGIHDGGYSEGFGDALAILLTRDSIIGRDFGGPGEPLRDAKDVVAWPDVMDNEDVHEQGRPYGGFVWELIQQLRKIYKDDPKPEDKAYQVAKELILGAAFHDPLDTPHAVRWSFAVDVELYPGKTGQKSKHYAALVAAAKSRKLPLPEDPADLMSAFSK